MLGITGVLLVISMLAFFTKWVAVKMLPFDNKNEIQVVIDMPEGTTLEKTSVVAKEVSQYLRTVPEVVNYQNYVGSSSPITFNGLVRHYDMRGASNTADIQVNLLNKSERSKQSHDVAKTIRPESRRLRRNSERILKLLRFLQDRRYFLPLLQRFTALIMTNRFGLQTKFRKFSSIQKML